MLLPVKSLSPVVLYNCFCSWTVLDLSIFLSRFRWDKFSLKNAIVRIKELYFSQKQWFQVKSIFMMAYKHYLWIIELSFWRHPFTAEDPLVSTWCNAKWRNKLIYILDGLRNFYFCNYFFSTPELAILLSVILIQWLMKCHKELPKI